MTVTNSLQETPQAPAPKTFARSVVWKGKVVSAVAASYAIAMIAISVFSFSASALTLVGIAFYASLKWIQRIDDIDPITQSTKLHQTIEKAEILRVRLLLFMGANPNGPAKLYDRVLFKACYSSTASSAIVQALLKAGAEINHKENLGTALHAAVWSCQPGIVKILLGQHIDRNLNDFSGRSASQVAEEVRATIHAGTYEFNGDTRSNDTLKDNIQAILTCLETY